MTPKQAKRLAIRSFKLEFSMCEVFMLAAKYSKKAIAQHKAEVLHRYGLTEKDVQ